MRGELEQEVLPRSAGEQVPVGLVASHYQDFYASFTRQNYGEAYASFDAALNADADLAYR